MSVQDMIEKATEAAFERTKEQVGDTLKKIREKQIVDKLFENVDFAASKKTVDDFLPPATVLTETQLQEVVKTLGRIQENLEDLYRVAYRDGYRLGLKTGQEVLKEKERQSLLAQLEVELTAKYGRQVKVSPVIVFDPEEFKPYRPVRYGDVKLRIDDRSGSYIESPEQYKIVRDLICKAIENAPV